MVETRAAIEPITYSAALNEALREEMQRDSRVIVIGEDVAVWGDRGGVFGVTKGLADDFGPERVRDTPISEEGVVAMGVGAAVAGLRPVVELMYFDFVTLAMDPLVNQAAKLRYMFGGQAGVPLVVRSNIGASGGKAAQHSQSLESWLVHVPGLKVVVPSTPSDAKGLLKTAIRDDNPVIFLEHKLLYFTKGEVPTEERCVAFGEAVIRREGSDVTVVATHAMLRVAAQAAEILAMVGIELEIIDPRTLVPLDVGAIVESVRKTNRLLICHEAVERGGWAGEVAMQVMAHAFDYLDAPIARVCGANVPMPYSAPLEDAVVPNPARIVEAVRSMMGRPGPGSGAKNVDEDERSARPEGPFQEKVDAEVDTDQRLINVFLPRLSDTMDTGHIGRWLKAAGDRVDVGDELVELETDKVSLILQAEAHGVLQQIVVSSGQEVAVGAVLATILPGHD